MVKYVRVILAIYGIGFTFNTNALEFYINKII